MNLGGYWNPYTEKPEKAYHSNPYSDESWGQYLEEYEDESESKFNHWPWVVVVVGIGVSLTVLLFVGRKIKASRYD